MKENGIATFMGGVAVLLLLFFFTSDTSLIVVLLFTDAGNYTYWHFIYLLFLDPSFLYSLFKSIRLSHQGISFILILIFYIPIHISPTLHYSPSFPSSSPPPLFFRFLPVSSPSPIFTPPWRPSHASLWPEPLCVKPLIMHTSQVCNCSGRACGSVCVCVRLGVKRNEWGCT